MFELYLRLLVSGALVLVSGATGWIDFDLAWKTAAAFAAFSLFSHRLRMKNMLSPGVAGFFAVADSFAIAFLLGGAGQLSSFGYLVLIPCALAASLHHAQPIHVAPLATAALFVAHAALTKESTPPLPLLLQGASALALGLLIRPRSAAAEPVTVEVQNEAIALEHVQLREEFRLLKEAYRGLERDSGADKLAAQLVELKASNPAKALSQTASRLLDYLSCDGLVLYAINANRRLLVVRATAGRVPNRVSEASIALDSDITHEQACNAINALWGGDLYACSVPLISQGHLCGMISIAQKSPQALEKARLALQDAAHAVTALVEDLRLREVAERRIRESELLYELASLVDGADSRASVASRVVRELADMLNLDSIAVFSLDGEQEMPLAKNGEDIKFLHLISFGEGPGLAGWLQVGAPELALTEALSDPRCQSPLALKSRVGSYVQIPLGEPGAPFGYLAAATRRSGGIDLPAVAALRLAGAELARALARFEDQPGPDGEMTPREFHRFVGTKDGCLVFLEPLRREQMVQALGKPAVAHGLRRLAKRVRARLPIGGAVCRRSEGDLLAFLPGQTEETARRWANEVAATASLIGMKSSDGTLDVPLALRARVAAVTPQDNQFLTDTEAEEARTGTYA